MNILIRTHFFELYNNLLGTDFCPLKIEEYIELDQSMKASFDSNVDNKWTQGCWFAYLLVWSVQLENMGQFQIPVKTIFKINLHNLAFKC